VLYPKSPRALSAERAGELARRLPPFVQPVLLFVNASPGEIDAGLAAVPGALLQFHGDETPADCAAPGRALPARRRAWPRCIDLLDFARRFSGASALLLDAPVEGYGGGGKVFDWSVIPTGVPCPVVLSGGLNPASVIDGMRCVRPWAVDVSSGVEAGQRHQGCGPDAPVLRGGARHRPPPRPSNPEESTMFEYQQPDARGHFGPYGGSFVAETLIHALDELKAQWEIARSDPGFEAEFRHELKHFVGRPTPVYHADAAEPRASAGRRSISSARTSTTPARTRSTTPSARPCWRVAWASRA
jgi:phosphoribosylanthranilate isomerase